ncbi:MAG: hypothetical protein ACREQ7_00355 [Candidatus Binatia bacterium]
MSDSPDEKLERMFRSRRFEPASPDLAERIVLRAQSIPQKGTIPLTYWLRGLFAEFHLARPAYVLTSTLILGFVIGLNSPVGTRDINTMYPKTDASANVNVQSFLYADEDIL